MQKNSTEKGSVCVALFWCSLRGWKDFFFSLRNNGLCIGQPLPVVSAQRSIDKEAVGVFISVLRPGQGMKRQARQLEGGVRAKGPISGRDARFLPCIIQ